MDNNKKYYESQKEIQERILLIYLKSYFKKYYPEAILSTKEDYFNFIISINKLDRITVKGNSYFFARLGDKSVLFEIENNNNKENVTGIYEINITGYFDEIKIQKVFLINNLEDEVTVS